MDIELIFVNKSNDVSLSDVVFFQQDTTPNRRTRALAWKVIKRCGRGDCNPFTFPPELFISVTDAYGNRTAPILYRTGEKYALKTKPSGHQLVADGPASSLSEMQIINGLYKGAISVTVLKEGRPIVTKTGVVPRQQAVFNINDTLFMGVASQITVGQAIDSLVISSKVTELSLLGIASATIVMKGGGCGPKAMPFSFHFDDVVLA